jgi:hypothetical protein
MENEWADVRCTWLDEARWCRSVLAGAGIEALIPDEHTLALPLDGGAKADAVRVLVRSTDLERALELLDEADRGRNVET